MSAPDDLDLPPDLRARIATIVRPLIGPIEIAIRGGQWLDGIEHQLDAAITKALGGHDGLVIAEQSPPAPRPAMTRAAAPAVRADEDHFLTSRAWLSLRYRVLKKFGARCQCCGRGARDGAIIQVDHIKPRSRHPELALRADNLQVLCRDCNLGKGTGDATDWRPRRVEMAARR
jgi:hypothetical protein